MARRIGGVAVLLFVAALACPFSLHADDEVIKLFDGKSFDGWTSQNGNKVGAKWQIVDGMIHFDPKRDGSRGNLITDKEYRDYELSFEWKISKRGNSGLKYRVKKYGGRVLGCEYQILDDEGRNQKASKGTTASLYALYAPSEDRPIKPAGEFNTAKIVVCGNRIEHWLNGEKVVRADVGSEDWNKQISRSKFNKYDNFGENRFGRIMLTDHGSEVWYRNITLRPLSEEECGSVKPEPTSTKEKQPERPNILFIFTDDHAPHAIGAYGGSLSKVDPTPNIDRLAREGMLFQNSFCTNSICGPSRAVIQTGKHSHINGFMRNGNRFDGSQQTFPKLLQKAGYETAIIGKWHLGTDPQGYDHWQVLPGQGDYYNPDFLSPDGKKQIEGYCTDIVTDLAIDWLKQSRDAKKPFMLMCQHKAPHRCWMPPLRHLSLYDDRDIPVPDTLFDEWKDNASPARHQEMTISDHMHLVFDLFGPAEEGWDPNKVQGFDRSGFRNLQKMTDAQRKAWDAAYIPKNSEMREAGLKGKDLVRWKYQRYIKNYLRCVKGVDESVGRLMDYLDSAGLAENTIVIYSSDQGFYLGDHGWYDKRWMYEESLEMPLIVKWPGKTKPGTVNEELVQNLDYAETFLDIAGAKIPKDMQGRSLVPLLEGKTPKDWRDAIYYHYFEYPSVHMVARHDGIRTDRYKLIRFYQFGEWEFYDLEKDPDERTNEYDNPEYADEIARLKKQLESLRKEYGDDTDVKEMPKEWQQKFR